MTTKLTRFSDAYATLTFAFYQPLTIRWVSGWTLSVATDLIAVRVAKARSINLSEALSTAAALKIARKAHLPDEIPGVPDEDALPPPRPVDATGNLIDGEVKPIKLAGFPDAVTIRGRVYPFGIVDMRGVEPNQNRGYFSGFLFASRRLRPSVQEQGHLISLQ